MKELIRELLKEGLFDDIPDEDFIRAYKSKINQTYDNLLDKGERNQNYLFLLGKDVVYNPIGQPNKCETNVFNFIRESLLKGNDSYYPVGGFGFDGRTLFPFEHWWIFDTVSNKSIEITPMSGEKPRCYAGVINKDIQNEITKVNSIWDIDFFKGGNVQNNYFK
jgi:hypothetical protein